MIPTSGPVSLAQVNAELARPVGTQISLNDMGTRLLTRNSAQWTLGTQISLGNLRGGKGYGFKGYVYDHGGGIVGVHQGDTYNPSPLFNLPDGSVYEISTGYVFNGQIWTRVLLNGPAEVVGDLEHYWGLGVWNASLTYLGLMKKADRVLQESNSVYHGVGWAVGSGGLDLRNYANQYLTFVLFVN